MTSAASFQPNGENGTLELLASYATGRLSPAFSALVTSHLAIVPDNRAFVRALEALGSEEMEKASPLPVSRRNERLAAIFDADPARPPPPAGDNIIPAPLAAFFGHGFADIPWRWTMPGLRMHVVGEASLLWVKPGRALPSHTHRGLEATLVLKGCYSDETGTYKRGDIGVGDDALDHRPVAGAEDDCICLVVAEGPLRLTGPIGRWIERLRWQ